MRASIKSYRDYLRQQGFATSTIKSYVRSLERFLGWCRFKGYRPSRMNYQRCLEYVKEIQLEQSISKSTVQHQLGAIKHYFSLLVESEDRFDSPMENINIRGIRRTVNHSILEFEELEDLFFSMQTQNLRPPNCPHVAVRNKVITGLMVYQGLGANALMSLKSGNLDLDKPSIYVPSSRKTNARELDLRQQQLASLQQYLTKDRLMLCEKIGSCGDNLFPRKHERSSALLAPLFRRLKQINYKVRDSKQVRASVISHWLKLHNIRQVQYMAGHRYISSTERYLGTNIVELQEAIMSSHPIS